MTRSYNAAIFTRIELVANKILRLYPSQEPGATDDIFFLFLFSYIQLAPPCSRCYYVITTSKNRQLEAVSTTNLKVRSLRCWCLLNERDDEGKGNVRIVWGGRDEIRVRTVVLESQ